MRVLSWGCGVQSTTLAVMSALGDLEPLDAVINADTGWERALTYEMRDFYTAWLREREVRVEIVTAGNVRDEGAVAHIHIPFWTSDGGPLQRQCTMDFKIVPVKHCIRKLLGLDPSKPPNPEPNSVEQWIGFSLDEWTRIKESRVKFITHRWPLVEQQMTRQDCKEYLGGHGLPVPPKSACIGCPYRQASEWIVMRDTAPDEFADAVTFDEANRHNPLAIRGNLTADELFIYSHGGALADASLEADAAKEREREHFQMPLLCESGYCWT